MRQDAVFMLLRIALECSAALFRGAAAKAEVSLTLFSAACYTARSVNYDSVQRPLCGRRWAGCVAGDWGVAKW